MVMIIMLSSFRILIIILCLCIYVFMSFFLYYLLCHGFSVMSLFQSKAEIINELLLTHGK